MDKELILGPPGTGKTTKLIGIVSDLMDQGVSPDRIAYVSFTNAAADEARDRALEKFDVAKSKFRHFRTLHSTAWRMLGLHPNDMMKNEHWEDLSRETGVNLMPQGKLAGGFDDTNLLCHHLHLAKDFCRSYEQHFNIVAKSLDARAYNFGRADKGGNLQQFVRVGKAVEDYKTQTGLVDFHDMLERGALCEPLDVDYAIIDEAQDLSRLQWRFCRTAFKNCDKVWIAGDDDQAIYSWSGADIYTFRHMEAQRTVLNHSWRLPPEIWKIAQSIVSRIQDRYPKEWGPREGQGQVSYIGDLSALPLDNDESWYLLTRTRALQQEIETFLRSRGHIFLRNRKPSVDPVHLNAAITWHRLLRGYQISVAQAQSLYGLLREHHYDWNEAENLLRDTQLDDKLSAQDLMRKHGLKIASGSWYDVLAIPDNQARYYRQIGQRGGIEALQEEPRIQVSTIHGVKGGEADNVYFSTSMGYKPYRNYRRGWTRDSETRLFYVAATRAKKRLFIKKAARAAFIM